MKKFLSKLFFCWFLGEHDFPPLGFGFNTYKNKINRRCKICNKSWWDIYERDRV